MFRRDSTYMDQGALVAVWATKDILSGEPEHLFPDIFFGWRVRRLNLQRRANERESPGLGVMGEPAEEAYFLEAAREDVQKEPANELVRRYRHGFALIVVSPIPVTECDPVFLYSQDAIVAYGDAMSISAEIFQHLLRPGKGTFGIDDPVETQEMGQECIPLGLLFEASQLSREDKFILIVQTPELSDKEPCHGSCHGVLPE